MRKLILMTSAAVIAPLSCFAEDITCTATPNCADLGYTESSCPDNKGVKCPWGEAWFCPPSPPEVCEIGSILYSDMTCYKDAQAGKTPIGVVVYVDGLGGGQAMALKSIGSYKWATKAMDFLELTNYSSTEAASQDVSSCENSKIIMAAGDKSTYPAVWAVNEYSTEGTKAGDWCLPAAGIFTSYYNNQDIIGTGFDRAGGTKYIGNTWVWSSSIYTYNSALGFSLVSNYGLGASGVTNLGNVHPVFEFVQTFEGVCKGTFKYTCKGENETGGVGEACRGRYAECSCDEGYAWWQGKCIEDKVKWGQCTGYAGRHCQIGDILFSDGTCNTDVVDAKTPIAVVAYISHVGCGQALALKSLDTKYAWGGHGTDISGLTNYTSNLTAATDYASCENSKIIMAAGDKNTYSAVWAANEYSTEGTSAGDWCLPAAGIFTSYKNNQPSVNLGFERVNGTAFTSSTKAWASSEYNSFDAFFAYFGGSNSTGVHGWPKRGSFEVRPVLEF